MPSPGPSPASGRPARTATRRSARPRRRGRPRSRCRTSGARSGMAYRPTLTRNARPATYTVDAVDEKGAHVPTPIAGEHPLTLYVDKKEIVTLMTLGAAPEALAIGFLRNQRLVSSLEEIVAVQVDWEVGAVAVTTRSG